ncbi:hypothetical protein TruAng_003247 [Truncatella angustata]|nr:hypothetical protein TruAng_003247 [Truncatella angustata]
MYSKAAFAFGFVAAASAQSDSSTVSTASSTDVATVLVGPGTTSTVSPALSVTVDAAVINGSVSPSSSSIAYTYYNTTVTAILVVAELITVCGAATTYNFNGVEYPATEGQTVTVTNCPCTITTVSPPEDL